ncbi:MAG: hypothetical protein Q7N87_02960 [Candidatus Uhrbacteria bacterium]|nr:hypothetical protein [Candidatus Uhrbacteria bacterium]
MSVHPALFDIAIDPGQIHRGTIEVTNDDVVDQTYDLSIQKFLPQGESGQQEFLSPQDISGLPSWMYFPQPSITLKAGESRRVPFMIRVPQDARTGGHYAAVFFSTLSPSKQALPNEMISGSRTGVLLLVTVNGELTNRVELEQFVLTTPLRTEYLPALFSVQLKNTGSVHVIPEGNIKIKNWFGQTVATLPINPQQGRVLPDSTRRFLMSWSRPEWKNFAFGVYSAHLEFRDSSIVAHAPLEIRFEVWPWHLSILVWGGIVILFLGHAFFKMMKMIWRPRR